MNLTSKKILVTGGAGFIGSHVVDALAGFHVRVLDNFSTGSRSNIDYSHDSNVEVIEGDIQDRDVVRDAMDGIDIVFHLACRGVRHSIGNPRSSHDVNATGTLELLQAALRNRVQRFVHVSSSEVYGTARQVPMDEHHTCFPETVYGAAKLAGECYARAYHRTYGLPVVVVRPFNNFGPRSHFEGDSGEVIPRFCVWAMNQRPPTIFGDGMQTRDFIYVEDTALWLRKIAETDAAIGKTINLGSGKEVSVNQLAEIIYKLAGCKDILPRHTAGRPGDVMRLVANTELASRLVGFRPTTSLEVGISRLLKYLRQKQQSAEALLGTIEEENWQLTADEIY
ncbi:MAG: NAD-dependent epimerase/dehydratase family protein [Pirellula staleyi]